MSLESESEVSQSCPTLCDPMDCSPPGSSIHGIFQARVLEWGAIAFSVEPSDRKSTRLNSSHPPSGLEWVVHVCLCTLSHFSHVRLFATPWTAAHQAPLSMEFSRQEYWNGLPSPSPGDLPNLGIELGSPAWQAVSLPRLCITW